MTISTSIVSVTVSGTSFSVDVTSANLSDDLTEKDFVVVNADTGEAINNSNFTKDSSTQISYSGSDVGTNVDIQVARFTLAERYQTIAFASALNSTVYNEEVNNILRMLYELQNSSGLVAANVSTPLNEAYGSSWGTDETLARTAKVIYDEMELKAPIASPVFTGNPVAPTQSTGNDSTRIATTAYVQNNLASYAPIASPALTGNPTAPTQSFADSSTKLATTAFVRGEVHNSVVVARVADSANNTNINTYLAMASVGTVTEELDTDSIHVAGTSAITIPNSAWYEFGVSGLISAVPGTDYLDNVYVGWKHNTTDSFATIGQLVLDSSNNVVFLDFSASGNNVVFLNAGDVMIPQIYVGMGGSGQFNTTNFRYWLRRYY